MMLSFGPFCLQYALWVKIVRPSFLIIFQLSFFLMLSISSILIAFSLKNHRCLYGILTTLLWINTSVDWHLLLTESLSESLHLQNEKILTNMNICYVKNVFFSTLVYRFINIHWSATNHKLVVWKGNVTWHCRTLSL